MDARHAKESPEIPACLVLVLSLRIGNGDGLRHDRIISVRRRRMNGKASLASPPVDAGNIVPQIGDATASYVTVSSIGSVHSAVPLSEAAGKAGVLLLLKYMYI